MDTSPFKNLADEKLLEFIREGDDRTAFDEIFNRYWERLFMYAAKVIRDEEEAQDIVQEVLVSLWQRRENLSIDSLSSYLYGAIRFKGLAYVRANLTRNNYLESLGYFFEEGRDLINEQLDAQELETLIRTEIDRLPPRMKEIFILSRIEQLSHKEIAERLNISDQTVKKQINLSLKLFRLILDERSGTVISLVIARFLL